MSFNEYMHSRNRYRTNPPDFQQLAEKHPALKAFLIAKSKGGVTLDFRDPNAVRALTIATAKEDFNLDLDLSLGRKRSVFLSEILFSPVNVRSSDTENSSKTELSSLDRRFNRTEVRSHWN